MNAAVKIREDQAGASLSAIRSAGRFTAPTACNSAENASVALHRVPERVFRDVCFVRYARRAFEAVARRLRTSTHQQVAAISAASGIPGSVVERVLYDRGVKSLKGEYLTRTIALLRVNGIDPRTIEGGDLIGALFAGLEWE